MWRCYDFLFQLANMLYNVHKEKDSVLNIPMCILSVVSSSFLICFLLFLLFFFFRFQVIFKPVFKDSPANHKLFSFSSLENYLFPLYSWKKVFLNLEFTAHISWISAVKNIIWGFQLFKSVGLYFWQICKAYSYYFFKYTFSHPLLPSIFLLGL